MFFLFKLAQDPLLFVVKNNSDGQGFREFLGDIFDRVSLAVNHDLSCSLFADDFV